MRTTIILTVAAITITALAYHFIRENAASERLQASTSQNEALSSLEVQDKLDTLASSLHSYQQTNQEQLQQAQLEQSRLNKMLADLDTRLRSLETAGGASTPDAAVANSVEQAPDTTVMNSVEQTPDLVLANSDAGNFESGRVAEADLGHWMDQTLHAGYWDGDSTALATEQATKSLAKVPGVILEDMQCGESFCRATFSHENGEQPDLRDLFGEPPFVTEGFTVNQDESGDRVLLYFARPGVSLGYLRSKAQETAQLGFGAVNADLLPEQ